MTMSMWDRWVQGTVDRKQMFLPIPLLASERDTYGQGVVWLDSASQRSGRGIKSALTYSLRKTQRRVEHWPPKIPRTNDQCTGWQDWEPRTSGVSMCFSEWTWALVSPWRGLCEMQWVQGTFNRNPMFLPILTLANERDTSTRSSIPDSASQRGGDGDNQEWFYILSSSVARHGESNTGHSNSYNWWSVHRMTKLRSHEPARPPSRQSLSFAISNGAESKVNHQPEMRARTKRSYQTLSSTTTKNKEEGGLSCFGESKQQCEAN